MGKFDKLFQPGKIGNVELANRLVVPAMVANMNPDAGKASEQYIRYHEEKAKGGWGLIITEDYCVNEHAAGYPYIAGLYNDDQIESHKKLTETIHKYGTKIFAQIYHAGRQATRAVNGGMQPVSCSSIPCPWNHEVPHELTVDEIHQLVKDFGDCAARVKAAGFDGVEIHAAHGYLIHEFISANCNKRIDEYGGTYDNRMRFFHEVYDAVRAAVGPDFPVQARISAEEETCGGRLAFESEQIFKDAASWGLDCINVSASMYGTRSSHGVVGSFYMEPGFGARFAKMVKELVDIPVIAASNIHDPYMAEGILERGEADFIGMARPSLCEPHLPNLLKEGRLDDIRQCVGCLQGCTSSTYMGVPLNCMVNPELGHEFEYDYAPVDNPKKVFVAGGGVAGMEAARAAAIKGHDVTLFEATDDLGGQYVTAAYPPYKGIFASFPAWQLRQLKKFNNVEIKTGAELTSEMIDADKPDKVIIATGARPHERTVEGAATNNVVDAQDVLRGKANFGMNVLVVGGGMIGSETASYLSTQCLASVAISTRQADIGGDMDPGIRDDLKSVLQKNFVDIFTHAYLKEITADGAWLEINGEKVFHPCDTVVTAFGTRAYNPLSDKLVGKVDTVVVGDALKARTGLEAIREGFAAGFNA
jgi:2,4-dienoyl-CoA reductase-like NADH-dependent reductase (Old Yellow Enzyme family)/NADPH-dependent 2,4-dienoyl-CoA reductase/sulfur reductase-like enzyme